MKTFLVILFIAVACVAQALVIVVGRMTAQIGITVVASTTNNVTLAWSVIAAANPLPSGYRVYQGLASRDYTTNYDAGTNLTYNVTGLLSGTTYYFDVTAYYADGIESDFSQTQDLTVYPPLAPQYDELIWTAP